MADKSENYMLWYNIWLAKQANQVIDDAKTAGAPPPSIEDAKKSVKNDPNHEQNWMASDIYKKQVEGPNNQIPRGFNTQDRITTSMVRKRSAQIMKEDPELSEEEATVQADKDVKNRQERDNKDISGSSDPVAAKILNNISSILMNIGEDVLAIRESGPNGLDAAEAAREKAGAGLEGKDEELTKAESYVERLAKIVSVLLIPFFLGLMSNFADLTTLSGLLKVAFIGLVAYFAGKALLTLIGTALLKLFSFVAGSIGKKILQLFAPNLLSKFISPKVINAPGAIIYAGAGGMGGPMGGPMGGRAGRDRNRVPNAATQARYERRYGQAAASRRFGGGGRFGTLLNLFGLGTMTTGGFGGPSPPIAPRGAPTPTVTPAPAARPAQPRDARGRFTRAPTVTPAVPTPTGGMQAAGGILGKAKALLPAAKGIPILGTALTLLAAGSIYGAKRDEGKSKTRAGVETAGTVGGGVAGGLGGAAAGAALGTMIFPGVGTAIGGLLGGIAGSMGGAALGDSLTSGLFDFFAPSKKKEGESGFNPLLMSIPLLGTLSALGAMPGSDKKEKQQKRKGAPAGSMLTEEKVKGDALTASGDTAFKDTASGKLLRTVFPVLGLPMAINALGTGKKDSLVSSEEEIEGLDAKKAEETKKGLDSLSKGLDSFSKVIPGVSVLTSILTVLREIFGGDSEESSSGGGDGETSPTGTQPASTPTTGAPPAATPIGSSRRGGAPMGGAPKETIEPIGVTPENPGGYVLNPDTGVYEKAVPGQTVVDLSQKGAGDPQLEVEAQFYKRMGMVNPVPTQPMQTERLNNATQDSISTQLRQTAPAPNNTVVQQNAVNNSSVNYSNNRMGPAVQGDALTMGCA